MRYRLRTLFIWQAIFVILLILASALNIVQFHYPRIIESDPLLAPIRVVSATGNTLTLADGRRLAVQTDEPLDEALKVSDFRIDIEPTVGREFALHVKRRGWICGTPYMSLITIPLIPDDVSINHRGFLGTARLVATSASRND
jgi:hypothetical protein